MKLLKIWDVEMHTTTGIVYIEHEILERCNRSWKAIRDSLCEGLTEEEHKEEWRKYVNCYLRYEEDLDFGGTFTFFRPADVIHALTDEGKRIAFPAHMKGEYVC